MMNLRMVIEEKDDSAYLSDADAWDNNYRFCDNDGNTIYSVEGESSNWKHNLQIYHRDLQVGQVEGSMLRYDLYYVQNDRYRYVGAMTGRIRSGCRLAVKGWTMKSDRAGEYFLVRNDRGKKMALFADRKIHLFCEEDDAVLAVMMVATGWIDAYDRLCCM